MSWYSIDNSSLIWPCHKQKQELVYERNIWRTKWWELRPCCNLLDTYFAVFTKQKNVLFIFQIWYFWLTVHTAVCKRSDWICVFYKNIWVWVCFLLFAHEIKNIRLLLDCQKFLIVWWRFEHFWLIQLPYRVIPSKTKRKKHTERQLTVLFTSEQHVLPHLNLNITPRRNIFLIGGSSALLDLQSDASYLNRLLC